MLFSGGGISPERGVEHHQQMVRIIQTLLNIKTLKKQNLLK